MATLAPKFYMIEPEEQFSRIMAAAMVSGCAPPDADQITVVLDALYDRFKWVTVDEFTDAFKMNIYGDFGKKTDHYNSFSMDYVVQVLNAYKNHKAEAILKSERHAKQLEMEAAKRPTEEMKRQSYLDMMAIINLDFNNYKLSGAMPRKLPAVKYDFICLHKFVQEPSNAEKVEYSVKARKVRLNELKGAKIENMDEFKKIKDVLAEYEKETLSVSEQGEVRTIAKMLALVDWFDSINEFPAIR
jgi:hypothetical protein